MVAVGKRSMTYILTLSFSALYMQESKSVKPRDICLWYACDNPVCPAWKYSWEPSYCFVCY